MTKFVLVPFQVFVIALAFISSPVKAQPRVPKPSQQADTINMQTGERIQIPANKTALPLYIYGDESGQKDIYVASGYMGDGESIQKLTSSFDTSAPVSTGKTGKTSLKIEYHAKGRLGWAGLYWLTPANNWGKIKGAGYDLSKAKKLTFWVRGEKGGEKIAQVKMGSVTGPYPDTDGTGIGPLRLSRNWEQYTVPLDKLDLRHIVGGFGLIFRREDNPFGATIYLDEIVYVDDSPQEGLELSGTSSGLNPGGESNGEDGVQVSTVPKLEAAVRRVILFPAQEPKFSPFDEAVILEVADLSRQYPTSTVIVEGHTSDVGSANDNLTLSRLRAEWIAGQLKRKGVETAKLMVVGYGEERPIADNTKAEGREKNSRVEIVVTPN